MEAKCHFSLFNTSHESLFFLIRLPSSIDFVRKQSQHGTCMWRMAVSMPLPPNGALFTFTQVGTSKQIHHHFCYVPADELLGNQQSTAGGASTLAPGAIITYGSTVQLVDSQSNIALPRLVAFAFDFVCVTSCVSAHSEG